MERILGRKLTSDERRKLERAFELALEYGKRFHDIYRGVGEDVYDRTAAAAEAHRTEGYRSVEYAEKTLGIDFLEKVGDIILEINRIIPGITKPEEIYGDRWYEFLKKKGIDPKTLEPVSGGNQRKGPADGGKSALPPEVLAIVKALEFSDFSENVMKKAEEELLRLIDDLLEDPEGNALEITYAVRLLRLVQRGDVKDIKKLGS